LHYNVSQHTRVSNHAPVSRRLTVALPTVVLDITRSSLRELRESLQPLDTTTPVCVIVPAWLGVSDRHHLVTYLDPGAARQVTLVSSSLAALYAHHLGRTDESTMQAVLCLDLRSGWSAGLVRVEPTGLTEVASWGAPPHDLTGRIDDEVSSRWLVDHLWAAASTVPGTPSISAVLVMDDDGLAANLVRRAVPQGDHTTPACPVFVKRARQLVTRGARMMQSTDGITPSVGSLARALAVLATDDPQQPAMKVVAAEHALFPSTTRLTFDLGPDDGSPLHFDVFEQERSGSEVDAVKGRTVLRAHLVRERGYDRSMVVTFELSRYGLFKIGPAQAWRLEWEPPTADLEIR